MKKFLAPLLLATHLLADGPFVQASYTYWIAGEEGLDLGRSGSFAAGDDPFFNSVTTILSQPSEYRSGFQVGAGWERNRWTLFSEYTWVRNSSLQSAAAPNSGSPFLTGVWLIAPWFLQQADDGGSLSGTQIASRWQLGMDIGDLTLKYQPSKGARLTLSPFGGFRVAWIRQKMDIDLAETPGIVDAPPPSTSLHSTTGSHCWSLGPRVGAEAKGFFSEGFRIEGDLALSLLFTNYGQIFHREDPAATDAFPQTIDLQIQNQQALRPVFDCGFGFGWSRSFQSDAYRIDVSGDYEFMYWWNQNVMRQALDQARSSVSTTGDLYLHGLTATASFGF